MVDSERKCMYGCESWHPEGWYVSYQGDPNPILDGGLN